MRLHARVLFLALITSVLVAFAAPAAAQAAAGIESFFASNCKVNTCKKVPKVEEKEKAEAEGFTQAGGHPNFGITDFKVNTEGTIPNEAPAGAAEGAFVEHIRTDVAPGVATNPQAVNKCSIKEFEGPGGEVAPGFFLAPTCEAATEIGVNNALVWLGPKPSPEGGDLPLEGKVYNLEQPKGLASDFGVALKLPLELTEVLFAGTPLEKVQVYAHTLIEGSVEWGAEAKGTGLADYHDYFEINVSTKLPLISSRLTFNGRAGDGGFLTNPTSCTGIGPQTTTKLKLEFANGTSATETYEAPIGTANCGLVPFEPGFSMEQETTAPDTPDGVTTEFSMPHQEGATEIDSSDVKTATVVLPPGLTLSESAGNGLEACTAEQVGIGTKNAVNCPAGSKLGTVRLDVPGLPPGSLQGSLFLGAPVSGPITEPPYIVYVSAESERYGVIVRLRGETKPDPVTGQLTVTFTENPEQPFSNLQIHLNTGPLAPLANTLACEAATASTTFTPFTLGESKSPLANFEITGCPATVPFALTQSTQNETSTGGGHTSYTLNLGRADGQQYLQKVKTTLPEGLVGAIPNVALCAEAPANEGTCGAASQIGIATVTTGSGRIPASFSGKVYMTGPYNGAPYGLSIVVPAVIGPFNLGPVVTRSTINVDPFTARVTAESVLPKIVKGIPVRIRSVSIDVNKQGFLYNPTSCAALSTDSVLTSMSGATQEGLSSPFQLEGCSALKFKPTFAASTSAKFSKNNGASLVTKITQPAGQANIKSVVVMLPKQLPSRLSTLQKSCTQATFEANPLGCPAVAVVGKATVVTPTLPGKMTGPAIEVSHGGAAFPDLDLVLEDQGVRVILVGKTDINEKTNVTTSSFVTNPDVPVSSVEVNLGLGPHSALSAFGNLCAASLVMPTSMTAQNGVTFKQNTKIAPTGCGVQIVGHKVVGKTAYLTLKTFAAGRITASGAGVSKTSRSLSGARTSVSLKVRLTRGKNKHVRIRVGFVPKKKGAHSTASVGVTVH